MLERLGDLSDDVLLLIFQTSTDMYDQPVDDSSNIALDDVVLQFLRPLYGISIKFNHFRTGVQRMIKISPVDLETVQQFKPIVEEVIIKNSPIHNVARFPTMDHPVAFPYPAGLRKLQHHMRNLTLDLVIPHFSSQLKPTMLFNAQAGLTGMKSRLGLTSPQNLTLNVVNMVDMFGQSSHGIFLARFQRPGTTMVTNLEYELEQLVEAFRDSGVQKKKVRYFHKKEAEKWSGGEKVEELGKESVDLRDYGADSVAELLVQGSGFWYLV